jgi:hypothetical protein
MRQLFSIFVLITAVTTPAWAQDDPAPASDSQTAQPNGGYGGYGRGGYDGSRAQIFVSGFGLFGSHSTGNAIGQQQTESAGASAGYRFQLNAASALEGRYGFSRDSQKYTIGSAVSSVPAYISEVSGSYVYSLARSRRLQPFLEGGGGLLIFIPGNYGGGATAPAYGTPTSGLTSYSGTAALFQTQAKGMFVYGAGFDVPAMRHVDVRFEMRGLAYKAPDFGMPSLQTNIFTFAYQPAIGFAYRF